MKNLPFGDKNYNLTPGKESLLDQQLMEWDSPSQHPAEKSAPSPAPEAEPQEQEAKA